MMIIIALWVILGTLLWFKLYPNGCPHHNGLSTVILFLVTWPFCTIWAIVDIMRKIRR